ncbi:MAG: pirin family protein [Flavobacteriaceae bacterium]|jgi:redox-sensitive bicupin YhaK (pirin superfamily)|nr:pirin family protein [Flavobacteriaceae bacterium]
MKTQLYKSETRGQADHGWLQSHHSFSFGSYYDPERMNFGALRVLNDDTVAPGMGFSTHPHRDMEIISIPLEGDLEHQDSMGNKSVIQSGDVQVLSAGTGISHSEYNKNKDIPVKFLQIWVVPNQKGVAPRYDQITLNVTERKNKLQQILSPFPEDEGVWIHQNAWFYHGQLDSGKELYYQLHEKEKNGVYAFVLEGDLVINSQQLSPRDGLGVWQTEQLHIKTHTSSKLLLMEVPMTI